MPNDPNKTLFGCMDKVDSKKANYEKHREYDKANTIGVYLKLNKKTDADIIAALEGCNKQGYIKALIRRDLNAEALGIELIQYFNGTTEA